MRRFVPFLVVFMVAGLALPLGCAREASSAEPEAVELRSYQVPEGFESEVRSALRSALSSDQKEVGRVSVGPAGQIVVVAPPSVQRGVESFIENLAALGSPPDLPAGVSITYWLVLGRPAAATTASAPGKGRGLGELAPVLQQLEQAQGSVSFELLERLQLSSTGESQARTSGRRAQVHQRATAVNGEIVANIDINLRSNSLSSQVLLKPGQFLVLAQTGYSPDERDDAGDRDDATLYYVIRPELAE